MFGSPEVAKGKESAKIMVSENKEINNKNVKDYFWSGILSVISGRSIQEIIHKGVVVDVWDGVTKGRGRGSVSRHNQPS
jgi:hypothetical protein